MNKILLLLKLSFKFTKRYLFEYLKSLIIPVLLLIFSFIIVGLSSISPIFAILALFISIPLSSYAVWKIYVIFYALIPLSHNFISNSACVTLNETIEKINQKKLVSFAGFYCIIALILLLPIILITFKIFIAFFLNIENPTEIFSAYFNILKNNSFILIADFIAAMPFLFLALQAYYFKNENENNFSIIKNCYKNLNKEGVIVLIILSVVQILSNFDIVFCIIYYLFLTPCIMSLPTFWYYSRIRKNI